MAKEQRDSSLPIPIPRRKDFDLSKETTFFSSPRQEFFFSPREEKRAKARKDAARLMEEGLADMKSRANQTTETTQPVKSATKL
ncbi:hypothetical protein [Legionella micdadei]|uniref:Uncharacterized protein n=1 Tax=Legionella micdadei TaxID=451 RepID=A0A098GII5_LEGMI|nr:hypothetical protein [Legionella micdadei]ARG96807.1 hypothetical protein B6N58_03510 [Legionella micdadei]ARG99539.1 hypothetical protein B6V88_03420 [Legionella micdadei]KTD26480.1 hypothetical protein Lmic_2574 [Legionella micdadei]NSL17929.1 hypothetical protein [Legionella micdadei]CEG61802.1 protein of unknown function [Legionella micdadei]